MALVLSSFELQKRYWYLWNQEIKMHQLRGGHMGLGSKPILRATLLYILLKSGKAGLLNIHGIRNGLACEELLQLR